MNYVFFITCFPTGIIIYCISLFVEKYPPTKKNKTYGYRTRRSMKDDESWLFAQNYSNPILKNSSIGMMGLGLLGLLLKLDETYSVILAIIIVLALCLAPIYLTEKALKERFPDKF